MRMTAFLVLIAASVLPAGTAGAQLLFGSRVGQAHLSVEDTKIIMQVGADMLRTASDGESRPWSNPQTGHSGTITIIRSYERDGMPCRDTRVSSVLDKRNVTYALPVCQVADGTWKFAAR